MLDFVFFVFTDVIYILCPEEDTGSPKICFLFLFPCCIWLKVMYVHLKNRKDSNAKNMEIRMGTGLNNYIILWIRLENNPWNQQDNILLFDWWMCQPIANIFHTTFTISNPVKKSVTILIEPLENMFQLDIIICNMLIGFLCFLSPCLFTVRIWTYDL